MVRDGLYNIGLSGYIREAGNCVLFETNVGNRPAIVVLLGANDSKPAGTMVKTLLLIKHAPIYLINS